MSIEDPDVFPLRYARIDFSCKSLEIFESSFLSYL